MMAFIKLQPLQSYRLPRPGLILFLSDSLRFTSHLHKSADAEKLLTQQRLNRPVSPHLSIYRPQITWIVSICTRITGFALASGMYLFATAYLLSPVTGWNMSSEFLVTKFSSLSPVAKFALKLGVALPFTFHCFNGTRHLVWDAGRALSNKQVVRSGWIVVGASGIAAVLLASRQPCDDTQAG
ncbi:succinate dehydrogenase cytochrome B subunit [Xylogone sp. PMI_703]|nr:succinate dehydrogenase cytochrome B subunit [Xylogone sp. PMI_703]